MKKVLVVGGTGFIGANIVDVLLDNGLEVVVLGRSEKDYWADHTMRERLSYVCYNLYHMHFDDFTRACQGCDTVIFAAGTDERVTPRGDAYSFFMRQNTAPVRLLAEAAKEAGVKQLIVMNSMFSYLDRSAPELKLTDKHPYIRSRVDQRDTALEYADDDFKVFVFEIPYVFGADRHGKTQWQRLVDYMRIAKPLVLTDGGANILSVKTIAQACLGVVNGAGETGAYPIGDENLSWIQLVERLEHLDKPEELCEKTTMNLSTASFDKLSKLGGFFKDLLGIKSGLSNDDMAAIVTREIFFDAPAVHQQLNFEPADLDEALLDTLSACPKKSPLKALFDIAKP